MPRIHSIWRYHISMYISHHAVRLFGLSYIKSHRVFRKKNLTVNTQYNAHTISVIVGSGDFWFSIYYTFCWNFGSRHTIYNTLSEIHRNKAKNTKKKTLYFALIYIFYTFPLNTRVCFCNFKDFYTIFFFDISASSSGFTFP